MARLSCFLSLRLESEVLTLLDAGHTVGHPSGSRSTLEVVVEELLKTDAEVDAIATLHQVVGLVVVLQQPGWLT